MNAKIDPDTVTRPMIVIKACLPQGMAGQNVNMCSCRALWEPDAIQGDMPLKHQCVMAMHFGAGPANRNRPGHICGPVQILAATVNQV